MTAGDSKLKLVRNRKTARQKTVRFTPAGVLKQVAEEARDIATMLIVYERKDGTVVSLGSRMNDDKALWLATCLHRNTTEEIFAP